jgi:ABC-type branched-subunit amino acid transport system substrate-binding protein
MKTLADRRLAALLLALLAARPLAALSVAAPGATLSAAEERGKRLYRTGESPAGGEVVAILGGGSYEVPAATVPCGGCHGHDGKGRPEGGVTPSAITWDALSRPAAGPGGRSRAAYTAYSLKRAITLGLDPGGTELQATMPRYRMSAADMADLLAYLARLGAEPVPGVSDAVLRIGTVLPEGRAGAAVEALLAAHFAEVNRAGGLYGRKLELAAVTPRGTAAERRAALSGLLAGEGAVFALVAPFLGGGNAELAPLLEERQVPAVGAVSPDPHLSSPPERYLFYLSPGLAEPARVLVDFAARSAADATARPAAILAGDDPALAPLAVALAESCRSHGFTEVKDLRYKPGALQAASLARELQEAGVLRVFFAGLGRDELALLAAGETRGWHPQVLSLGPLAGLELWDAPKSFAGRLFLAFPSLPIDLGSPAVAEYRRLAQSHPLPDSDRLAQLSALAAAKLLVEALKQVGRQLTREGLVDGLETIHGLETGFTPPLSYGPNRRIAARGAYVVGLDLERRSFTPAGGWIELP